MEDLEVELEHQREQHALGVALVDDWMRKAEAVRVAAEVVAKVIWENPPTFTEEIALLHALCVCPPLPPARGEGE